MSARALHSLELMVQNHQLAQQQQKYHHWCCRLGHLLVVSGGVEGVMHGVENAQPLIPPQSLSVFEGALVVVLVYVSAQESGQSSFSD